MALKPFEHSVHPTLPNIHTTFVERMLGKCFDGRGSGSPKINACPSWMRYRLIARYVMTAMLVVRNNKIFSSGS